MSAAFLDRFGAVPLSAGQVALGWLGQASFALRTAENVRVYIDPYLSNGLEPRLGWRRWFAPPVEPSAVRAEVVVLTHDHLDHVDPDTIPALAEHAGAVFVGPQTCLDHARTLGVAASRCQRLEAGDELEVCGVHLRALHADHMHPSAPTPDAISVLLELGGVRILDAADTTYRPEVATEVRGCAPDVLLTPINGRWGNMDGTDAAQYAADSGARRIVPMHYGLLPANTADPSEFLEALRGHAPEAGARLMAYGEVWICGAGT